MKLLQTNRKKQFLFLIVLILGGVFYTQAQVAQPFTPRLPGGNIKVKGDMVILSNNILNTRIIGPSQDLTASHPNNAPWDPDIAYNDGAANNQQLPMAYIDVDSDTSTFSSSSATLNAPTCSRVIYAGLYWGGTYPFNEGNSIPFLRPNGKLRDANLNNLTRNPVPNDTNRDQPYESAKFKAPGGAYVDIGPGSSPVFEYERIYDFDGDLDRDGTIDVLADVDLIHAPYLNYANVTSLVTPLGENPNGEYTIANVVGTLERKAGGNLAGWTMVIIYENPNLTSKYVSTFDGFAAISSSYRTASFSYTGFRTLPGALPVKATIGVSAMEGDLGTTGPQIAFKANSNTNFTILSDALNPANNFFNSTISNNGNYVTTRNPASENTLGWDTDVFEIDNVLNSVLPNDETGADVEIRLTSGDITYLFLNTISVDIIEPEIILEKRVNTLGGTDITGLGVNLDDDLVYVLSFQNRGNDDATNYTIRDVLPINVFAPGGPTTNFLPSDIILPDPRITYTYNIGTREIIFSIPDDLVVDGAPEYDIRMQVKVAATCADFVDACTDLIQNLAYSTYRGALNTNIITDDPSVADLSACGIATPGATNFLLDDLSACDIPRTAELCGATITLDAGNGFDKYVWYRDENGNNVIDLGIDTLLLDGGPGDDTLVVSAIGTYIVDKQIPAPCIDYREVITVVHTGALQTNPIVDFFNDRNNDADPTNDVQGEIVNCDDFGVFPFPQIFLCGVNDSQLLQMNIAGAESVIWQQLDETSCPAATGDCPNTNLTCGWTDVATGNNFTANSAGQFRLVINYEFGCFSRFYFDVFQNNLPIEPPLTRDIICGADGNITMINVPTGYGYQLIDVGNGTIPVPFSANNGPSFDISSNGTYRVEVVQLDLSGNPIPDACIFSTENLGILNRVIDVDITTTEANCNVQGTITIAASNVLPDYTYEILFDNGGLAPAITDPDYFPLHPGGTSITKTVPQASNTHTFNVNAGDYFIITRTDNDCIDVQSVTVTRTLDPTLTGITTANIGCDDGTIQLTAANGNSAQYYYAIWSKDGTDLYALPTDIPPTAFQTGANGHIFNFTSGEDGDYEFIVVDANNCYYIMDTPITITDNGALVIDAPTETQPSCNGDNDGAITINITGGTGPFQYSIDNGGNYQGTTTFAGLTTGNYTLRVLDNSGCDVSVPYNLSQPDPFSASAGISRDFTCNPTTGAEVRITNVVGGNSPYSYSFDGGENYGTATSMLLPAGTYTVIARDASCEFPMTVVVPDLPTEPLVTLSPTVDYNCDGTGNIVVEPNITTYNYTYEIDDVLNAPDPTSNTFNNLPVRSTPYKITTNYISQIPPMASELLREDFGSGPTIPSTNTTGYYYEDQTSNPGGLPGDNNSNINDLEHAVTSSITAPFGAWLNPVDHTTGTRATNGRYLAINIGSPGPGQAIYKKPIKDIIPNQPLTVSLYAINLLRSTHIGQVDPDLTIELRLPGTTIPVASQNTGTILRNDTWNIQVLALDPGANTSLDLVIVTNESDDNGNDVAIDDILIQQTPEVCELFVEAFILIEPGKEFAAAGTGSTDVSCNGLSDGTITFSVENFDPTDGFDYSTDNWATFTNTNSSPITTGAVFGAGDQTVLIRRPDDFSCATSVTRTIAEPGAIIADGNITTALTCDVNATITASATGGIAPYHYQLQDAVTDVPILGYDFATNTTNIIFSNLPAGSYEVAIIDRNGLGTCPDISDPINIIQPIAPTFTATPILCYSGNSDGTITVVASGGNGVYQFKINDALGNPWISPDISTPNTYTFTNLSEGSYTIDVKDSLGCDATQETGVTINTALSISATAPAITACATSTDITITATGGTGSFQYAVVPDGATPGMPDYNASTVRTVFAPGDYDIYLRNPSGGPTSCTAFTDITIIQHAPIAITPTPTAVTCNGGNNGAINIGTVTGGEAPFTYSLDNGVTVTNQLTPNFSNLVAGNYTVQITDTNGCQLAVAFPVTINEPDPLSADAPVVTQLLSCPSTLAQITVSNPLGGTNSYQYSINGSAWTAATPGGHVFTGLSDGVYVIQMRDANATTCSVTLTSPSVTVNPLPTPPTISDAITYNCDGTGNVTILPFDATYTYTLGALPPQTGAGANVFNNVAVGNHSITVEYGSNCSVLDAVNVLAGNAFDATITASTNPTCNTDSDGTITISAENFGAGGFEYRLNDVGGTNPFIGPFFADEQIINLSGIAYAIEIRDVSNPIVGCTVLRNRTLTAPAAVVPTATITTPLNCNTGATITVSAIGGTPGYTYQLENTATNVTTPYQSGTTFTNVAVGSYFVRALDSRSCAGDSSATPITVDSVDPIVFSLSTPVCYDGTSNGTITLNISAGNNGYQVNIDSGSGPGPWLTPNTSLTSHVFSGLSDGTYFINVRDSQGCGGSLATRQSIAIDPQLIVSTDVVDVSSCADGNITVNASGGIGTLVYSIVPAGDPVGAFTITNTLTVTNVMALANPTGYDIYVRDSNGAGAYCEVTETGVIVASAVTLLATGTPTDPECFNEQGSIQAAITGGRAPYTYTLVDLSPADGIDFGVTYNGIPGTILDFNGIGAGDYQITVTDANTCSYTTPTNITVTNATDITIDLFSDLPPDCTTARSTTINVLTAPTNTLIRYSADGGTTWQISNIFAGASYTSGVTISPTIEVTRPSGTICTKDFPDYIVPYPLDDLDITLTAAIIGCELEVTVEGDEGTAGYRYTYTDDPANFATSTPVWTAVLPDNTPHTFANIDPTTPQSPGLPLLVPGRTYVFYVEDSAGCIRQSNVNVNDIITLPMDITSAITPTCNGATTGEITFTLTPGTPSTDMRWEIFELGNSTPIETSGGNVSFNSTITSTIGLAEGDYYIEVTQVNLGVDQCTSASENAYVNELDALTGTPNPIRDISCNLPGLIQITGLTGGGGAPYTFDVTGPAGFTALTGLNNNPIQIPVNSPAGNYTVTVNDQYGCPLVLAPVALNLSPNPTFTVAQDNCSAPITVTVTAVSAAGNIRYAMVPTGNPTPTTYLDNSGVFNNVVANSYDIYIIDGNGCTNMQTAFVVNPVLDASATLTKLLDCTGTPNDAQITINIANGSNNYDYSITNTAGEPAITKQAVPSNSFVYNAPSAGDYTVTIYDNNTPTSVACNREFIIPVIAALNPVLSIDPALVSNETCEDADDGSFTVSAVDNGSGPFTFQITASSDASVTVPINPSSADGFTAAFSGLTGTVAGTTYTVTATSDTNDCADTINQVITEPLPIVVPIENIEIVPFACVSGNNQNNASITVNLAVTTPIVSNVTGGSGNYVSYRFVDNTTATILQDGPNATYIETTVSSVDRVYDIYVYDDIGCFNQIPTAVTILGFDELLTPTITVDEAISCANLGEDITINAFGSITDSSTPLGLANYEFRELPNAFSSVNQFTDLAVGIHTFEVRNINTNCITTITHEIVNPNTFEVDITGTTNVTCVGDANGVVTFTITDATYTGSYSWSIFDDNGTPLNYGDDGLALDSGDEITLTSTILPAGSYYISVAQDGIPNCDNRETFNIAEPTNSLTADRRVTEITCTPTDNGIIEIFDAQGGWGDYRYLVFDNATVTPPDTNDRNDYLVSPRFENLVAATYQVWVIDTQGCPLRLTDVTLTNPALITAALQINQQNCTNFDGIIEVVGIPATNPVAGGQGSNYTFQLIKNAVPSGAPQTTTSFLGLGAGAYTLTVTDQWGCTFTTPTAVTLYDQIVPQATIAKAIDCNSGGTINVTQTGGSGTTYTYEITAIDGTPTSIAPTSSTATTASFVGLTTVGVYTFTITDDAVPSACSKTILRELVDIVEPVITLDNATNVTCNGNNDGTITVSVADNGLTPYTFEIISTDGVGTSILPSSNTTTTATFTGLAPTNGIGVGYTVRVLGDNGCDDTTDVTITEPAVMVVTFATPVEFLCAINTGNNENNASISVQSVIGGSNNYVNYQFFNNLDLINPVQEGTNDTYIETDFAGGNYTVIVFDDNGCSNNATASIAPFDELISAPITQTSVLCAGEDISIDAISSITNFTGNPGNYEFREVLTPANAFQASNIFPGLGVGVHNFEVRNIATGCSIIVEHIVQNPNTFNLTVNKLNDVICNGSISGAVTFNVTDAVYTGSFDWEIFETNGTLGDELDDTSVISGSTAANSTTSTINLIAGSYRVRINQAAVPGCDLNRFFTITEPELIVPNVSEETGVTCTNDQGSILINPDGGVGPFTITLTNTTSGQAPLVQVGVSAYLFENLSGGIFDVQIEDTVGCIQNFPAIIELEIPELIVPVATQGTLNCFNENTASITAAVNPRTIPATPIYSYQLNIYDATGTTIVQTSSPQGSDTFSDLTAGIYSITVTDDAGCFGVTNLETIVNPNEVFAQLARTSPLTCATGVEFILTATGGTGPYEYYNPITNTWIAMSGAGGTSEVFPNANYAGPLGAGTYQFMVRDAFDCESILSNAITEDLIVDLSIDVDTSAAVINCNGQSTAIISASADGGMGNYMYELYHTSINPANRIGLPQSSGQFNNLPADTYFITVSSSDCLPASEQVIITEPTPLQYTETVTNVLCFDEENGSITVALSGGVGRYQYAISPNLTQYFDEGVFTDLAAGDYTVLAQDGNGCPLELQYTITEPVILEVSATSMPEICVGDEDGVIDLAVQGGTAPYSTRLSDEANFVQDRVSIANLASGGYIIFIRDANGCEANVSITVNPGANLNAIIEPVYECTGDTPDNFVNITLEDPSVIGDVLYALDSTDPADMQLNPDFRNSAPGTHYIAIAHSNGCVQTFDFEIRDIAPLTLVPEQNNLNEITAVAEGGEENYTFYFGDVNNGEDNTYYINRTDTYVVRVVDANGCESIASIFMEFIDIEIPNFFTPDGDGLNDFWVPRNMEAFPEIITIIFDRYGREVYRLGVGDPGWGGIYNESELPTGDYWYVIKLKGENDDREFVGNFTLYR